MQLNNAANQLETRGEQLLDQFAVWYDRLITKCLFVGFLVAGCGLLQIPLTGWPATLAEQAAHSWLPLCYGVLFLIAAFIILNEQLLE